MPTRGHPQPATETHERDRQAQELAQLDCLRHVPEGDLRRLAPLCVVRVFDPGALIVDERLASDSLYLVLSGTVNLTLHDRGGNEILIGVLSRGDCFGEGPLFGDLFRGATASANARCALLRLPLAELRPLLDELPGFQEALRAIYRRRLIERTLGLVPLFGQLSPLERANLARLVEPRQVARGEVVVRQGEPGDALYLIEAGQAVVERDGLAIAHLDEGSFFGEMSLLANEPHTASVRALTPLHVFVLPAQELGRLLGGYPELRARLEAVAQRRRAANSSILNNPAAAERLAQAVSHGMLRGTRLLVRDPQLCPEGCRGCEDACAARHGHARLRVDGVPIDGVSVADACRQCRVGAECVEACPQNALQWNRRGALIITDACNGCGACVDACLYDAVRLVPLRPAAGPPGPLRSLWQRLRQGAPVIPLQAAGPTHRADKCDLCHGYSDLACVRACPTGALRLVPVEELFPL